MPEPPPSRRRAARERLAGATAVSGRLAQLGALTPGLTIEDARDSVRTLISPEVYRMLVLERGWDDARYERWLARALTSALLGQP